MATPEASGPRSVEAGEHAAAQSGSRRRARGWLLGLIGLLYLLSVPWYRDAEAPLVLLFGLPDWVAVALGCYVGVAVLNALAWLLTEVRDDAGLPGSRGAGGRNREELGP